VTVAKMRVLLGAANALFLSAAALELEDEPAASDFCAFDDIFGAGPPPYYVSYKLGQQVRIIAHLYMYM